MAIPDIPVFSFRINRDEPLEEVVSFLTDVMRSREGNEQRRKLRLTPRRSYDVDLLLTGNERTYWDLFNHGLGPRDVLCPLYWETVRLGAALQEDYGDRIDFDTTFTEWEYQAGGAALIMRDNALSYEVVEIAAVDAGGVDLVTPVSATWPRGSVIIPLRRGKVDSAGELRAISAAVATVTVRLMLKEANPWSPAEDDSPEYLDLPVFTTEPNWVDNLSTDLNREIATWDSRTGLMSEAFPLNRIMVGQEHRWFLNGREPLAGFRDLIYRHAGRQGAFWLPTFKADLRLAADVGAADTQLVIEKVGYDATNAPRDGREHVAIKTPSGLICRKIISSSPGDTPETEKLGLAGSLGLALPRGQARRISFLDTARFDSDEFTITHHGGIDGLHESSARFRTFRNTRVPPAILVGATPIGVMTDTTCGTQSEDACPLFFPVFDGWDYEFSIMAVYAPTRSGLSNFYIHRPVEFGGKTGGGNAYGGKIGADWDEKFASSPGVKWGARRVRVDHHLAPSNIWDQSYTGTWHATAGIGIVNFFGEKPTNYVNLYFYWRHWTQPFPGTLAATVLNKTSNGDVTKPIPVDIDWRDYRTAP